MQKGKGGNLWVETCFLGKGLSPSKLSTKALCGDTRKSGNETQERERTRIPEPELGELQLEPLISDVSGGDGVSGATLFSKGGRVGGGRSRTLRLRRPRFCCCCCCSMSSMAVAGGEAARMARTTLMLSSGSGGRSSCSRRRTFISWSSSNPPRVN